MRAHLYATETAALRAVRVIDLALGPTEELSADGVVAVVARKTWAAPFLIARGPNAGQWAVPWKGRLAPVEGRVVDDAGTARTVPLATAAVDILPSQRD